VLNFPEEPETIADDTRETGPNFVIYGPRQWESLVSEIQVKMIDAHPIKRFCYKLFLPVGIRWLITDSKIRNRTFSGEFSMYHHITCSSVR